MGAWAGTAGVLLGRKGLGGRGPIRTGGPLGARSRPARMRTRRWACVVVDGYTTGAQLAPAFAAYGLDVLHVRSGPGIPDVLLRSFRSQDYLERYDFDGDVAALCTRLTGAGRSVRCVVAGAESGVLLADLLSERLGCPSNGTLLSHARRDKWLMSAAVADAGLATIPQLRSGDPAQILDWVDSHSFADVVLKPLASSATHGLSVCDSRSALSHAATALIGSRDVFGAVIDDVLVQPYLHGVEFCVNAVSLDGRHLVSDVWLTRKRRSGPADVYDLETLLSPLDERYGVLVGYVGRVLDALGTRYGPTHTEVMLTGNGPVLIESAARLMGSLDTSLVTAATGTNAVLLTAQAYLAPRRFAEQLSAPATAPAGYPAMVQMIATGSGRLTGYRLGELDRLPSFHGADTYLREGDEVVPTVSSLTSPGLIFLYADSQQQQDSDYRRIRELEREGALYRLG